MKTIAMWCAWLFAVGLGLAGYTATLSAQSTNVVPELLRQLGAEGCAVRDQAEAQLRALGPAAVPLLQPHAESRDPEIRFRVQRLLVSIPPDLRSFLNQKSGCTGNASEGETVWPCILRITEAPAGTNTFRGTIEWTNLNALHAIEGRLETNTLTFTETKIIRRGNAITGAVYTFPLSAATDGRLAGQWRDPRSGRNGPAELTLNDPAPATK